MFMLLAVCLDAAWILPLGAALVFPFQSWQGGISVSSVYVLSRLNFGDGTQKVGLHQRSDGTCFFFECRRQRATLDRPLGRIAPN